MTSYLLQLFEYSPALHNVTSAGRNTPVVSNADKLPLNGLAVKITLQTGKLCGG